MKKLYMLFFSLLTCGLITTNAQTSININSAGDSISSTYCLPNANVYWAVSVSLSNYTTGDSATTYVNFGDGITETERHVIYGTGASQHAWANIIHTYTSPGTYYVQTIVEAPDGKRDTFLAVIPVVINVCGNLEGQAYVDLDNNCTYGGSDNPLGGVNVVITDAISSQVYYAVTNPAGEYSISVPVSGSYSVSLVSPFLTLACPSGGHTGVTAPATADLGLQCGSGFDLFGGITGQGFRPGNLRPFFASPYNSTCTPQSGTITVVLSDPRISYAPHPSSTSTPVISGDSVTWNFTNIDYNSMINSYSYDYAFNVLTDTSAIIGDSICMEVIVKPSAGDNNPANNTLTLCFPIRNSFDPNAKSAQPLGFGPNHIVEPGTEMEYTIHFQNTGNDVAYNIFIQDTIDASLDLSTLVMKNNSHQMDWIIYDDNIIRFIFNGINLPDSNSNEPESHGHVTYSISLKNDVALGTYVENTAGIFFDFNEPIVTNTTSHLVDIIDGITVNNNKSQTVVIYPNPTNGVVNVVITESGRSLLTVRNMMGQAVASYPLSEGNNELNLSGLTPGMYLMEVQAENSLQVKRVIVK